MLRRLVKAGMRRGMAGNGMAWVVLAGAAWVLRRSLSQGGGAVSSVTVSPGEQVLITVRDPRASGGALGTGESVLVSAAADD